MRYFEDLSVGESFTTATATVAEEDIRSFAAQFDPQPIGDASIDAREPAGRRHRKHLQCRRCGALSRAPGCTTR